MISSIISLTLGLIFYAENFDEQDTYDTYTQ